MTLQITPYAIRQHMYQIVLIDMQGSIYESCDSIFGTEMFLGKSLKGLCFFFEGELDTILNSSATKITFEKIKLECEPLPGCYDFIFSKQELDGQTFVLWEIYDYTNIYEEFTFIQQLQNEITIQKQLNKKSLGVAKNNDEFFKSGYISNHKSSINRIIAESVNSKFDVFNQLSDKLNEANDFNTGMDWDGLENCADALVKEINYFVKQSKFSQIEYVEIRSLFRSVLDSHNLHFDQNLPQLVGVDENLVKKILQILAFQYEPQPSSTTKDIKVSLTHDSSNRTTLGILINENANFVAKSTCSFITLSVLKSLVAIIGGELSLSLSENKTVFGTNMVLPIEVNI